MIQLRDARRPTRFGRARYLQTLKRVLTEHQPHSAYYTGLAHPAVFRLLLSSIDASRVHAMDHWGRHQRWAGIDEFGEHRYAYSVPKDLKGITFWGEGGAPAEIAIRDIPWSYDLQLQEIVNFYRQPARIYFLVDEATDVVRSLDYNWTIERGVLIGVRRTPFREYSPRQSWQMASDAKAGSPAQREV